MSNAQYMKICTAMIDNADAMLMLPNWEDSHGAKVEYRYAECIEKPVVYHRTVTYEPLRRAENPAEVRIGWLKHDLEEVFKV